MEDQDTMQAAVIDDFGGPDALRLAEVPIPVIGPDEVLIELHVAGVGAWDPFEREGGYAEALGVEPAFPYILGSEGAGVVVGVGGRVDRFAEGDSVWSAGFLNSKGGFYAEYVAVTADLVSDVPVSLTLLQAGAMPGVALTALRGLDDVLRVQPGDAVAIIGASGGIGHTAVQLAKRLGARVLGVASGADGVALVERVGADAAIDGRNGDVQAAIRDFAPAGLDAVLVTTGAPVVEEILDGLAASARVAFPTGVEPEPKGELYNGEPDRDLVDRLERLIGAAPFEVHVARTFPLAEVADAHRALDDHHLGKLALRIS